MNIKTLALCAAVVAALPVFAAEKKAAKPRAQAHAGSSKTSLFFYQADAGVTQVTPVLGYESGKSVGASDDKTTTSTLSEAVRGEYGINEMLSVGLTMANVDSKVSDSNGSIKGTGFRDPSVDVTGRYDLGAGVLRFRGLLSVALQDGKLKSSGDFNMASGSNNLNATVGYEMAMGEGLVGVFAGYDLYHSEGAMTIEALSLEAKMKGGEVFDMGAYYEQRLPDFLVGGAAVISATKKSTASVPGVGDTVTASNTAFELIGYGQYDVNPDLAILPKVSYNMATAFDKTTTKSDSSLAISVGGRFSF